MGIVLYSLGISRIGSFRTFYSASSVGAWRSRAVGLEQVDKELSIGDERAALSLVRDLQGKPNGLRCFGAARQVPQRLYTLDELKLNGIEAGSLLSPVDGTLGSIERYLQVAGVVGGVAAWNAFGFTSQQIFYLSLGLLFIWTLDAHEAGHFLIAYLVGVLPKGYTLSSLEALQKEGSLNVQAGTAFVDFEFLEEVNSGKVSATLDMLLKGLGFTQKKADSQVRWSVLNTILLLRRHGQARAKLADAMSMGKSVGSCIAVIEDNIDDADI
ncbi:hypothetical protein LINPERPRIM_LOCUS18963 [Linum perenne]